MPFLPSPTPPPPRSNGDDDYDSVDDSDTACSGSVLAATTPQAVVDNNNVAVIIVIMDDNVTGWSFMVLLSMMMYVCRLCCLFVFSVCLVCCLFDWDVRLIWHFVKTNGRRQAESVLTSLRFSSSTTTLPVLLICPFVLGCLGKTRTNS